MIYTDTSFTPDDDFIFKFYGSFKMAANVFLYVLYYSEIDLYHILFEVLYIMVIIVVL